MKPFIGRVQVGVIEPLEITLMNLVKLSYPPIQQVTAIVFVGEGFSRVVFMRNGDYLAFSQPIHEGFGSAQVLNTIYSRILFEQDVSNLPETGQVILTGACRSIEAQPFFEEQFPDAQVDYLLLPELDLSGIDEQDQDLVSNFAVPIGQAWKALSPKEGRFYPSNFLPKARRRLQNPLELAWHGLVLLALLVASVLFLGVKARDQGRMIDSLKVSINLLEKRIEENNTYVRLVDELHVQIADYERNFSLIDTLSAHRVSWSSRLGRVDEAVQTTGGLWLDRFSTAEGDIDVQSEWGKRSLPPLTEIFMHGSASRRDRVPKIAERLGNGHIRSIVRSKVRGATVYEFDLRVPIDLSNARP